MTSPQKPAWNRQTLCRRCKYAAGDESRQRSKGESCPMIYPLCAGSAGPKLDGFEREKRIAPRGRIRYFGEVNGEGP